MPIGYSCKFLGSHVYVYQGSPIESIDFDTFGGESRLTLIGIVKKVKIARGTMDFCAKIVFNNPASHGSVMIAEQKCEPVSMSKLNTITKSA